MGIYAGHVLAEGQAVVVRPSSPAVDAQRCAAMAAGSDAQRRCEVVATKAAAAHVVTVAQVRAGRMLTLLRSFRAFAVQHSLLS